MNTFEITAENAAIIETLKGNDGVYVDDHNGRERNTKVVVICTTYVRESGEMVEQKVCGAFEHTLFSTNPLYVKEGVVHLDQWSHGPNVKVAGHGGLDAAVEEVNNAPILFGNPWHLQVVRF